MAIASYADRIETIDALVIAPAMTTLTEFIKRFGLQPAQNLIDIGGEIYQIVPEHNGCTRQLPMVTESRIYLSPMIVVIQHATFDTVR